MKPTSLLALMALAWALTNFWLVPLVSQHWKASTLRDKVARAGILAVLEKLRDLSLVAVVTLLLVIALVLVTSWIAASSGVAPTVLRAAESVYGLAKSWSDTYSLSVAWIGMMGVIICLYLSARNARRRVVNVWSRKANEVLEGFSDTSSIEVARNDPQFRPIVDALDEAIVAIEELRAASPTEAAGEAIEQRHAQISLLLNTLAVEIAAKDLDVEAALRTRAPEEEEQGRSFWARARKILASDQFAKDMGLLRKPMSYILMGLLVASLVGWTADPMANSLRLAVNTLRVNLYAEQADRDLDIAVSREETKPQAAPEEEDEVDTADLPEARVVARMLAHSATNAVLSARAFGRPVPVASAVHRNASTNSRLVRAALIGETPTLGDGATAAAKVQVEAASDLADGRVAPTMHSTSAFHAKIEQQIIPDVERLRAANPGAFARLVRAAEARYAVPMSALDAQGKIVSEMLGRVFSEVDAGPTGEAAKQAQRLLKEFGEKSFGTWATASAKRYVSSEIVGAARPDVIRHMNARGAADFVFEASGWVDDFADQLRRAEAPGTVWSPSSAAARETKMMNGVRSMAAAVHEADASSTGRIDADQVRQRAIARASRIQGYDALFPPELGSLADPQASSGAGGNAPSLRKPAVNFHRARISSVVRGVIIGRELEGPGMDIRGLRWKLLPAKSGPTRVMMEVFVDAAWKPAGTFDAAVVNQGLRYAADRRVIATTIVPGDGRMLRRITNTHPVLVDTPLGCRVIEVDRFVDTVTWEERTTALGKLRDDREQMSAWVDRAEAMQAAALGLLGNEEACTANLSEWASAPARSQPIGFSPVVRNGLASFVNGLRKKGEGTVNLLTSLDACAAAVGPGLAKCVCSQAMRHPIGLAYWYPEDHTSQVRERSARIDHDLAWLKPSPNQLGTLEFAVHTTFSVRSSEDGGPINEDLAAAYDFPPAQIDALRTTLAVWIPRYTAGANANSWPIARSYEDFMKPLEDFVILQRFFRAGLAGQLGDEFPLPRLLQLQRETRSFVPTQPTVRWEIGPAVPEDQFMVELKKTDPDAEAVYREWRRDSSQRRATRSPACGQVSK